MGENLHLSNQARQIEPEGAGISHGESATRTFAHPNRRQAARRDEDRRLHRRERELEAARRVSETLFQHVTTDELCARALQTALEVVGAESGSILLADPETRQLVFRHSIGPCEVASGTPIPWDRGLAGEAFHSAKPVIVQDAKLDPRHYAGIDTLTGYVTRDVVAIPLQRWAGEPIGVFEVMNKQGGAPLNEEDLAILTIVSGFAATSIEQARLYQEAKLAEVARIVGDLGHDIKNLLMPVLCGTGLLEGEIKDLLSSSPKSQGSKTKASFELCTEVIGMVRTSTRRIQDHVKEIADCVKGLSAPPQFAPCRVAAIVTSVIDTLRWLAEEKGVLLQSRDLDTLPQILVDERRLFNAFYNLVNNAIPEVQPGGTVTVSGQVEQKSESILLTVADTGGGMPPEVRDSLFTTRAKSRKPGGTGLGTKIVKDVVDAHGGTISLESQLGVGTTFFLRLPLRPPSE
ncbi:MAG: GAF domain-containing sensor histidine kinase [Nitrospiraceae bacterium]